METKSPEITITAAMKISAFIASAILATGATAFDKLLRMYVPDETQYAC